MEPVGQSGPPPPDWLINIKMPVLVKGIVYIYYGRYMDREGGVIVSDCYSYSAGSHATEHQCALQCCLDISEKRGRGARIGVGGPGDASFSMTLFPFPLSLSLFLSLSLPPFFSNVNADESWRTGLNDYSPAALSGMKRAKVPLTAPRASEIPPGTEITF